MSKISSDSEPEEKDPTPRARVVLAISPGLLRSALDSILLQEDWIDLVASVQVPEELLRAVSESQERLLVVLDEDLWDGRRLESLLLHAGVYVLLLKREGDSGAVMSALLAGAQGVMVKGSPIDILLDGLRKLDRFGAYLDPALVAELVQLVRQRSVDGPRATGLTERQEKILALAVDGHSNREIARLLQVSESTVKLELRRVYREMGVRGRSTAIVNAVRLRRG
ncbi:MAG: LuxR C-terminal-related transcriptional regulator [Candidatus Xenobia bacterium]